MPVCAGLVVWGMLDALHVAGVSSFCEAGERCVSGLAFGTWHLWWPWFTCLAAAWEAYEFILYYIIDSVHVQYLDTGSDRQWNVVRHFGFCWPVSLGAWSTWRGPWAAEGLDWRVNAGCVDVYILELDAQGTWVSCPVFTYHFTGITPHAASDSDRQWLHKSYQK